MPDNNWEERERKVEQELSEDEAIDIVIVSYNRRDALSTMLKELKKRTEYPYRTIVVDNGSTDGSKSIALTQADIPVFLNRNLGLEKAKNIGLSIVRSKLYVDSDNDIVPQKSDPCWLTGLIRLMEKHREYGAISLTPHVLVGGAKEGIIEGGIIETHCGAVLRIMDTAMVRKVGGWRNEFTNRSEEWHIHNKLKSVGYKTGRAINIQAIHLSDENWSYPEGVDHYHRDIWPPIEKYSWKKSNIDWLTCKRKDG